MIEKEYINYLLETEMMRNFDRLKLKIDEVLDRESYCQDHDIEDIYKALDKSMRHAKYIKSQIDELNKL